jgi:hypothetical protein
MVFGDGRPIVWLADEPIRSNARDRERIVITIRHIPSVARRLDTRIGPCDQTDEVISHAYSSTVDPLCRRRRCAVGDAY